MNIQTIPLNKLIPCPANVRKTGVGIGIEELAANIAAEGLLQNLLVRPVAGGKFQVMAGGRRLAALKLLAKQKAIDKTKGIDCHVRLSNDEEAVEISLAENIMRLPMHPADQFDAFHAMAQAGNGPEEIAARFGTSPATVRQRLKLAMVSPRLLDLYRSDTMDLDQLMAFAVTDDHAAQEAAWFEQPDFQHSPASIRRMLTAAHVEASNKRARFVGLDAYVAAGGAVSRDLFQPAHEGYLIDPALLDRLVTEKLEQAAEAIRAEGWAWVEIMPDRDWDVMQRFSRATPQRKALTEAQENELDRLSGEYEALIEEYGDDPEPVAADLATLSEQIDRLSDGLLTWAVDDLARGGAVLSISHAGTLAVDRGLIRPEDRAAAARANRDGEEGTKATSIPALSDRLIEDLTAHRTAALRAMLAGNPTIALAAVTHAMALPLFYATSYDAGSCLGLRTHGPELRSSAQGIEGSRAERELADHMTAWRGRLPAEAADLWAWLLAQSVTTLTELLACCAAPTVSAVRKAHERMDAPPLQHADSLAVSLGLDMAQWWQPTAASFFGRVSKARILDAVTEGCSKGAADNLAKLKKDVLATRAEEKLSGTGWLPAILRATADA